MWQGVAFVLVAVVAWCYSSGRRRTTWSRAAISLVAVVTWSLGSASQSRYGSGRRWTTWSRAAISLVTLVTVSLGSGLQSTLPLSPSRRKGDRGGQVERLGGLPRRLRAGFSQ